MKKIIYIILLFEIVLLGSFTSSAQQANENALKDSNFQYGSNSKVGQYAKINGINLYYEIYGNGEPILLLHGGLGSIVEFKNNIPELAKNFKVIAVDSRSYGRSNNNIDSLSYDLLADDMIKFMDYLGLKSTKIVGFSDGGVIGLVMGGLYPDRVLKVVTSGVNYSVDGLKDIEFIEEDMKLKNLENESFWKGLKKEYQKLNPDGSKFYEHIQLVRKMWLKDPYINEEQLKKIRASVLLMYGDNDFIKLEHAVKLYSILPTKKQLFIVPASDHFLLSKRSELVNPIIVNFLK